MNDCIVYRDGWQPLGGLTLGPAGQLLQAMVRYADDPTRAARPGTGS
jgi:hypothetical protein